MAENMTYEPVTNWRKRAGELEHQLATVEHNLVALAERNAELAARLAELEPSGFAMANSTLIQRVHQLERENAELAARLNAAILAVIDKAVAAGMDRGVMQWAIDTAINMPVSIPLTEEAAAALFPDMQPADDTDAPLKLAALDEDGDE